MSSNVFKLCLSFYFRSSCFQLERGLCLDQTGIPNICTALEICVLFWNCTQRQLTPRHEEYLRPTDVQYVALCLKKVYAHVFSQCLPIWRWLVGEWKTQLVTLPCLMWTDGKRLRLNGSALFLHCNYPKCTWFRAMKISRYQPRIDQMFNAHFSKSECSLLMPFCTPRECLKSHPMHDSFVSSVN